MGTAGPLSQRRGLRMAFRAAVSLALVAAGAALAQWLWDDEGEPAGATRTTYRIDGIQDVGYGDQGAETSLDVWFPETNGGRPTVVWVHGGGWVFGDKADVAPYLKLIAKRGYTTVGLNYSLAPNEHYPEPVRQVVAALGYLAANAERLHVDPSRIFLAGDSAGAQVAAQVALVLTDPAYAERLGIEPTLRPAQLAGLVLNCGPYDVHLTGPEVQSSGSWLVESVVLTYLGTQDRDDPRLAELSIVDNAGAAFPPTWLSGGNLDPLTPQGEKLAEVLKGLGVEVTPVLYPEGYEPGLGHEFQFALDTPEGAAALESTVLFLAQHS